MPSEAKSTVPTRWLARVLGTISGNLYLILGTLVMAVLAILVSWIPSRRSLVYLVGRLWSRGMLLFSGVRVSVTSPGPAGQYVFMSNHQSMYDIPSLYTSFPDETWFMAKRTLFMIPIFGWAMRQGGFISVDRRDRSTARDSFSSAVDSLKGGASVMIFPEGARSMDGRLQRFEKGGFLLALKSGLPIVPVGIRGAFQVRRRYGYAIRPGRIEVRFGEPIPTEDFEVRQRAALQQRVREEIALLAGLDSGQPEAPGAATQQQGRT